ncbi:MAG: c-type cytochrome, partial [Planctomycetes bacterium]|nr:c-type cytochrome [Planctomycetota bacterium]
AGFTFVDRVTHFQRYLAAPPQTPRSGMKGEQVFGRIGCAACHVATWRTADDSSLEAALRHRQFKPYSDFLLHDMGRLGDGIVQGEAKGREFRTTPLWGFRIRFPVMHDGRVSGATLAERAMRCIEAHDGEAGPSLRAYRELSKQERNQLIAFLDSLGRVEFDQDGDNDVDLHDWSFFVGCRTGAAAGKYAPDERCRIADIDGDGAVDLVDFAVLQQAFTGRLYGSVMVVP